jgi:alcohol dehydrogenase
LGHEPAGTVVEVGENVGLFDVGDEVGIPFNIACGSCNYCWDGESQLCANGLSLGFAPDLPGAFTTEFAIPNADFNANRLPEGMNPIEMAALGCRFATAFHALAHRATVRPGDWLAVHGCGGIGLSAVNIGSALGASVIAVDLDESALELAETVGAEITLNVEETQDLIGRIHDITDGGAAIAMDALGIADTCRNSLASLGKQGQHLQVGMTSGANNGSIPLPIDTVVNDELELIGIKGMPPSGYPALLQMIAVGDLEPQLLVTNRVALEEVSTRLRAMDDYGTLGFEVVTEF